MTTWVIVPFSRPEQSEHVLENFRRQTLEDAKLVLVCNGRAKAYPDTAECEGVTLLQHDDPHQSTARNAGIAYVEMHGSEDDVIALMDDDDYYAPGYLAEQTLFVHQFELVGKQPNLVLRADGLWLLQPELANAERNWVSSATMAWQVRHGYRFEREDTGEDIRLCLKVLSNGGRVYATSTANYCYVRTRPDHQFKGDPVDSVMRQGRPALPIARRLQPALVEDPMSALA